MIATNLTLVAEAGGLRHFLEGQPIHAGDVLEYYDPECTAWVSARFEVMPGQRGRGAFLCSSEARCVPVERAIRRRWAAHG